MKLLLSTFLICLLPAVLLAEDTHQSPVHWRGWSDDLFAQAEREKKLVLLDLEAVWCHWCHVMDQETYSKPEIAGLLNEKFLTIKVDQDLRPDLGNRYQDYGWPATIIFNSKGKELVKRAGFVEPEQMLSLLKHVVADPESAESSEPEVTYSTVGVLTAELREKLLAQHYKSLDTTLGGLRISHRYLDADSVEFALVKAAEGSVKDAEWVKLTLQNNRKLIDPIWGGAYQYSTHRDWDHPHFEKIMSTQAKNLRLYSSAFSLWNLPEYKSAAGDIYRYLTTILLSPDGVFYTSQDADYIKGTHSDEYFKLSDSERRKLGFPAIDKHIYSRENGWAIGAIVNYSQATGDREALAVAERAARWVIENRALPGGGFRHDAVDNAGPYLDDTLAMGSAFLSLYAATAERDWLKRAGEAAQFIRQNFAETNGTASVPGFITARVPDGSVLPAVRKDEENIRLVRFANLAGRYLGSQDLASMAETAMKYLNTEAIALQYITNAGILLADAELRSDPLHITVVGKKDDPAAIALYNGAWRFPQGYKRTEWWDRREGDLPNPDVRYPELPKAAAFICTNKRCSLPIFVPEDIPKTIAKFKAQK